MNSPYQTIDYTTAIFEHPVLTKIHGIPSFRNLTAIKKQLKANAQSVTSRLGGGTFDHLGLVLTPEEYRLVSDVPFVVPPFPGDLTLPRGIDPAEAVRRRDAHSERIRQFQQVHDVNKALIRQIVASVEPQYLEELRNDETNTITRTIPEILQYLFDNFADVTPEEVKTEEDKISEFHWNIADPPMVMFKVIDDLQKLAVAAKIPRTQEQLVAHGVGLIQKTGDFEKALLEWFELDENLKTWVRFKRHFTAAHNALKNVRGKTIRNTTYYQANAIVQEVNNNMQQMKSDILDSISVMYSHHPSHESRSLSPQTLPTQASSVTHSINNVSNEDLLKMIQQLQQQLQAQKPSQARGKRILTHYCWTHGACGHPSRLCRNKKDGHKDKATLENKLGGSAYYCKVATEQKAMNNT